MSVLEKNVFWKLLEKMKILIKAAKKENENFFYFINLNQSNISRNLSINSSFLSYFSSGFLLLEYLEHLLTR